MRRESNVTVAMLNDLIIHKITGMINKLEIVATDQDDRSLQEELRIILNNHKAIATKMQLATEIQAESRGRS